MKAIKNFVFLLLCAAAGVPAFADGTIYMNNPSTSTGTGWSFADNVVTITTGGNYTVTGTTTANRIVINKDVTATVTLDNAVIRSAVASPFMLSSDDTGGSDVILILSGSNELVTTAEWPESPAALTVENNAQITIEGNGSLTASGGEYAAGIGGGLYGSGGNITVTGGTITATGGDTGAGIGGGGWEDASGNITVTGGTIIATGGDGGAGIGGGAYGTGGNITVTGGTITATGGNSAAGIGGGMYGSGGNITIKNGTIIAIAPTGDVGDAAGIGGGAVEGGAGIIYITGGTVYASSGGGAGIGGTWRNISGTVNITGGTVMANKIGNGINGEYLVPTISGANTVVLSQTITATTFGGATVLTGNNVNVSATITTSDNVADVTLNADLTIPSGATLTVPAGIVFDVNNKALTNNGIIRQYGSMLGSPTGNQSVGAIQSSWIADIPAQTYTGDSIKPAVTVMDGSLTLAHGVHYSVAYSNNVNAGTATVTVTDLGDYHTVTKTFLIEDNTQPTPVQIAAGWIDSIPPQTYTGDSIKPVIVVKDGSKTLTLNTDYTVAYTNNINVGTATVTVTGKGNYTGSASKTFTITAASKQIAAGWIDSIPPQTYTGDSIKPVIVVKDGSKTLTLNTDYTVAYTNNINVGTATVTVTGKGNYTGSASKTFTITAASKQIAAGWIDSIPPQTYTGDSIKPVIVVKDGSKTLTLNMDYTVAYTNNINVGTATVTVTGKGDYTGSVTKTFIINRETTVAGGTINIASSGSGSGWTFSGNVVTITANGNYTITGTSTTNRIVINKDVTATITLQNASIRSAVASPFSLSSDDTGGSRVILILSGSNELVTTAEWPESPAALTVENNATISIEGAGSLTASGGEFAAGIGGGLYGSGGNITVTGGTITATGGYAGAGIGGGGWEDASGNITVTGGTIIATGGDGGAGIGGGAYGTGGNITVTGGTITATGGNSAAGIGGGMYGAGGDITINGGTITATGGASGAGIGGGWEGDGGNISISNGIIISVTSGGTGDPAGIGGGGGAGAGTVTVTGGTVYASGGTGPGIGGGTGATGGVIRITGGTVIAYKIGIGQGSTTATNISGANTLVLSQSINTTTFGGATVLTGNNVNVSATITTSDNVADVTQNAALTIPSGSTLIVPTGIVFDVNHQALTNNGTISNYGSIINAENLTGNQPNTVMESWIESIPAQTYTGDSIKPVIVVKDGSKTLTLNTDYTVDYTNNVNAGTATVTVTGKGNYTGSASKTFTITAVPKRIAAGWIEDIPPQAYTGNSITPAVVVKDSSKTLTLNTDYTVDYTNNVNAGTATVTVTGMGNYTGRASKTFIIIRAVAAGWLDSIPAQTYTGDSIIPALVVRDGSRTLTPGVDYTVSFTNNVNVGTATVMITGIGNYTGSTGKNFTISPNPVAAGWLGDILNQVYTGDSITLAVVVRDSNRTLTPGVDYSIAYTNNVNVGIATVTITGIGNYTGSASKSFSIVPESHRITGDWLDDSIPAHTYTGNAIRPAITVRNGDTTLVSGTDYTVAYSNNINAGTATVIVTGTGDYAGRAYQYFTIHPKPVADDWLDPIPAQIYTGDWIIPAVTVKDSDRILTPDTDYIVTCTNNVNVGTATATIVGTGNYTGSTASRNFTINPNPVAAGWIEVPNGVYTGDSITPAVVVKDSSRTLTPGVDYIVAYNNNVDVGTAVVTIIGVGNYTGSASKNFSIVPESHQITDDWLDDSIPAQPYTGNAIRPAVTVRNGDTTLVSGTDYAVAYSNNIHAGTATVIVTGTGDYAGTAYQYFTISPKPVVAGWIEDIPVQPYTGDSVTPIVVVRDGDRTLTPDTDYTVGYSNNISPGTAMATVTGRGNYTGRASQTFIITDTIPDVVAKQEPIVLQPDSSLTGGFTLSLSIPVDSKPKDGSTVTVTFPVAGFTLDTVNTKIADNLAALFELLFTRLSDVAWKLTIVNKAQPQLLRAAANLVTQDIADVKYIIDKDVPKNDYAITAGVDIALTDNAGAVVAEIRRVALVQAEIPRTAVSGVSFYNDSYIVEKGKALQLIAAIEPADADNRNVSWATSNKAVATIDGGQVRAATAGEANITVTTEDGKETATCRIQVLGEVVTQDKIQYNVIEKDSVRYNITDMDTVVYHIVAKDSTIYNLINRDTTAYNIIIRDSVEYDIIVRDSVIYNITARDTVVYNMIYKDSIDYTLVPERIYIATDITGAEHVVTDNARVVRAGTVLRIEGLKPGKTFSIYTIKGEKFYSGTAQSDVFRLDNIPEGVYILYHDGQYSKFSY